MNLRWPLLEYGLGNGRLPFGEVVGHPYNLAWPVNVYRVTLPRTSADDDGLNAFERLVVEMVKTGLRTVEAISEETCLASDMVRAVLARLRDKGLIDDQGNAVEDRDAGKQQAEVGWVSACVFQERVGGRILPFLHDLDHGNELTRNLDAEALKLKVLQDRTAGDAIAPLTEKDVLTAFRQMVRRGRNVKRRKFSSFALDQIRINPQPESWYLFCPFAFQRTDDDFRIADPFGNGFSMALENSFYDLLAVKGESLGPDKCAADVQRWYQETRQHLTARSADSVGERRFDSYDGFEGKYPRLVYSLRPKNGKQFRTVGELYSAVEWAFYYFCSRYSAVWDAVSFLEHTQGNPAARRDKLRKCLQVLDMQVQGGWLFNDIENITLSRLQDFRAEKSELPVVLCLALLMAEERDVREALVPLVRLGGEEGFLARLQGLRQNRNEVGHGQRTNTGDCELHDDSFVRAVVHALIPEIVFGTEDVNRKDLDDSRQDEIFNARGLLQGQFGIGCFNAFDRQLQDNLVASEVVFQQALKSRSDAATFDIRSGISPLYAACQMVFWDARERQETLDEIDVRDSDLVPLAEAKAQKTGLYDGHFPESLKPRPDRIRKALQGLQPELGGLVLAFLIMTPEEELCDLVRENRSFLRSLETLLSMRQHDNEGEVRRPVREIVSFRRAIYTTIKQMKEI